MERRKSKMIEEQEQGYMRLRLTIVYEPGGVPK